MPLSPQEAGKERGRERESVVVKKVTKEVRGGASSETPILEAQAETDEVGRPQPVQKPTSNVKPCQGRAAGLREPPGLQALRGVVPSPTLQLSCQASGSVSLLS